MNKDYLLFHLKEALEELSRTVGECETDPSYSESELSVAMQHLYHHLNTAWNTHNLSPEKIDKASDQDFNLWGSYPSDLETLAI
ncbi:MAG TPA: hypothetical protein DCO68_01065 [Methylophilaceae bacterium]|nr:hypothetical protein [Methylophilaceae bacterium]HAJ70648.1 hypothetical protein [Methylophilaceae bacterium]